MRNTVCICFALALVSTVRASYKEVDWIESPGSVYVNSGYVPTCADTFEMRLRFKQVGVTQALWCARDGMNLNTMTCFLIKDDKKIRFDRNANTSVKWSSIASINTDYTVVANYATCKASVDSGTPVDMASGTFQTGGVLHLFASYSDCTYASFDNYGTFRLYRFTVKNAAGEVLRDYVPVKDTVGDRYGLFETVTRRFCPGRGTGVLTGETPAADAPIYETRTPNGDVMADASVWLRGGSDRDGDGLIQNAEVRDMAFAGRTFSLSGVSTGLCFRTERVRYAYANLLRDESCLYFPQHVRTNLVDNGNGTVTTNCIGHLNKVTVPNFVAGEPHAVSNYTFFVRFRPDLAVTSRSDYQSWIVGLGHDWGNGRGIRFGLYGSNATNRSVCCIVGKQNNEFSDMACPVGGGTNWYEAVVTVTNAQKVTITLCQPNGIAKTSSVTIPSGNTAAIGTGGTIDLCNESASAGDSTYSLSSAPPNNTWKCFRGSVNQFAFWNRTLADHEIRQVRSYPRPAVMRLGLENGDSCEFANTAPAAAPVSADACQWTNAAPRLAAGGSYAVHFTLGEADATCPQILRLVTLPHSGTGTVSVAVNGTALPDKIDLKTNAEEQVFVPQSRFLQGDNVLTLTRTDAEPTAIAFDALELTGSWRLGVGTANDQFQQESQAPLDYQALDGTWMHLRRAVTTSFKTADAFRIHFYLPKGFADRYDYIYDFRTCDGAAHPTALFKVSVNDVEVYRTPTSRPSPIDLGSRPIRIPRGLLKDGENNVISFRSLDTSNDYDCFCRHRLRVRRGSGFVLIFR